MICLGPCIQRCSRCRLFGEELVPVVPNIYGPSRCLMIVPTDGQHPPQVSIILTDSVTDTADRLLVGGRDGIQPLHYPRHCSDAHAGEKSRCELRVVCV
jgi:hypothetical protein